MWLSLMAMYKETQTVVIYSCIIDFFKSWKQSFPVSKSKRNYEYDNARSQLGYKEKNMGRQQGTVFV